MDRIRQQKERLSGLSFTPQSEPSHALIDKVCQQLEDNVITYIELNRCTSRQDEALHSKMDTILALDNSGSLRLSKKQRLDDVNVTGEHKLRQAFLRRSLVYDLSGLQLSRYLTQIQGPYNEEEMLVLMGTDGRSLNLVLFCSKVPTRRFESLMMQRRVLLTQHIPRLSSCNCRM